MNELDSFFTACQEAFAKASSSTGFQKRFGIQPGGIPINLTFASPDSYEYVQPAYGHLLTEPHPNGFEISVWDRASSGVSLPECPWDPRDHIARGDVRGMHSETIRLAFGLGVNVLSIWNNKTGQGIFHPFSPRTMPQVYFGSPLLHMLQWAGETRGYQLIHGAAIAHQRNAVLLAGRGGAGKSTTSLTCLHNGLQYIGDDYCLIRSHPEPRVYSAFCTGKIKPAHLPDLPRFEPLIQNKHELKKEKALLNLYPEFSSSVLAEAPLQAILIPRVTGEQTSSIEPGNRGEALRTLGASTIFQMAGSGAGNLRTIAELVRQLPVYRLNAGIDLSTLAPVIKDWIESLPETE